MVIVRFNYFFIAVKRSIFDFESIKTRLYLYKQGNGAGQSAHANKKIK